MWLLDEKRLILKVDYNLNLKSMRLLPSDVVVLRYSFFSSSDMALHFFSLILFVKLYLVLWKTKKSAAVAIKPKFTQLPTWKRGASLASV